VKWQGLYLAYTPNLHPFRVERMSVKILGEAEKESFERRKKMWGAI